VQEQPQSHPTPTIAPKVPPGSAGWMHGVQPEIPPADSIWSLIVVSGRVNLEVEDLIARL